MTDWREKKMYCFVSYLLHWSFASVFAPSGVHFPNIVLITYILYVCPLWTPNSTASKQKDLKRITKSTHHMSGFLWQIQPSSTVVGFKIHPSDQGHFTFMPQANRWSYIKKQSIWETALFHRAAENTLQCICFCFLFTIISLCLPWQMWDWTLKCVVCLFPPQKSVSDSILNVLLFILVNRLAALNATLITNRCDTISN